MIKIATFAAAIAFAGLSTIGAFADNVMHKLAIHIDQNDPAVMNLALNNAQNVLTYYQSKGETALVELVAYGPGLQMMVEETSPVKARISAMSLAEPDLHFSACGNTLRNLEEKVGHSVPLVSEAVVVPSGVVRLMELDEEGYAYLRP